MGISVDVTDLSYLDQFVANNEEQTVVSNKSDIQVDKSARKFCHDREDESRTQESATPSVSSNPNHCLVVALRSHGYQVCATSNGPHWALKDGNEMLSSFGTQLVPVSNTSGGCFRNFEGQLVRWRAGRFEAAQGLAVGARSSWKASDVKWFALVPAIPGESDHWQQTVMDRVGGGRPRGSLGSTSSTRQGVKRSDVIDVSSQIGGAASSPGGAGWVIEAPAWPVLAHLFRR